MYYLGKVNISLNIHKNVLVLLLCLPLVSRLTLLPASPPLLPSFILGKDKWWEEKYI